MLARSVMPTAPFLASQLRAEVAGAADATERLVSVGVDRQDRPPVEQGDSRIALELEEEQRRARAHQGDASIGTEGGVARPRGAHRDRPSGLEVRQGGGAL